MPNITVPELKQELKLGTANPDEIFYSIRFTYDSEKNIYPYWYKRSQYPNYLFHYHHHEFLELIFLHKGKIKIVADFGKFTLKEEEILVVNSNEMHSGFFHEQSKDLVDYNVVMLNLRALASKITADQRDIFKNLITGKTKIKNHITPDTEQYDMLKNAILQTSENYISKNGKSPELMQLGGALMILSQLNECGVIYKTQINPRSKNNDFSVHVLNYIQSNYKDKITTKTASKFFSYDEAQFCRLFKKHFNMTFIEFLNSYRIKIASCYNITGKSTTIESIAKDVGYDNYSYFCRNFKKYAGMTPKDFFHNPIE